jgi:hypothetical protein
MKSIVLSVILSLSMAAASSQTIYFDQEKKRAVVEQKNTDLGKSKEEIHAALKYFISSSFKNGSAVIDLEDYDKGLIVTRGTYSAPAFPTYKFNLILRFRDNECMWTMTDIATSTFLFGAESIDMIDKESQMNANKKNIMRIAFAIRDGINSSMSQSLSEDW